VKVTLNVSLTLKATGATELLLGRATSKTSSCDWENRWRAYDPSIDNFDLKGGTAAGPRWVCAKFRDAAKNESGTARDNITFDHAPTAISGTFEYAKSGVLDYWCNYLAANDGTIWFPVLPTLGSDPDAGDSVRLTSVTRNGTSFSVSSDGRRVGIKFTPSSGFGYFEYTYTFVIADEHGITDSSTFKVQMGPCPVAPPP
jgi:hypothetical protein